MLPFQDLIFYQILTYLLKDRLGLVFNTVCANFKAHSCSNCIMKVILVPSEAYV